LEVFEGVLGGLKDFCGLLAKSRCDDACESEDEEERSFFSALGPVDG
jgi:hypothetical protein